ncbi:MAG: adenine phosphoribosyltransferase [Candidatus Marinimicrobia bacterium]|nr:adenine phosphoribosyltransferase [Candidatus Neomarinimicrobiota bacterium]
MNIEHIKKSIRNVPDFPKPGIQFKDITTLLQNLDAFGETIDFFYNTFINENIDVIVGIESRGFIFAAPLSLKLGCKFALARKPGKLPYNTISEEYELEYGTDAIEMHKDAIIDGDRVLIVDDLLATGGTANATGSLVKRLNGKIISYAFVIELVELNGAGLLDGNSVYSIVKY